MFKNRVPYMLICILVPMIVYACSSGVDGGTSFNEITVVTDDPVDDEDISLWEEPIDIGPDPSLVYPFPGNECVECKWYFCPPLDAVWQKQICIDYCAEPPAVLYEGECVEYLECDPAHLIIEDDIPCVTDDGYPGTQDKICHKGKIQYTDCETTCTDEICDGNDNDCDEAIDEGFDGIVEECNNIDDNCNGIVDEGDWECDNGCGPGPNLCVAGEFICMAPTPGEEICDGLDNDCDGETDEGQLNDCGSCGLEPEEICNGIDDNCDGSTDEDLFNPCSTACGEGYEICDGGNWISCTAPPVYEEICDGLDNDCDGQIDEELQCVCTVQDVGALFPCSESPLLCGQGYKTCDCLDLECKTIVTTPCYAICYWLASPWGSDPGCDPYVGMALSNEKCNNFDDDCDQVIDEDLFKGCYTGPEGTLYVGLCEPGEMTCDAGTWGHYAANSGTFVPGYCKDEITPQPEICNGEDDDCDGEVDWGTPLTDTDVLFIIDWSGSMTDEIQAVMTSLNQFAANFSDESVIQWGVILGPKETPPLSNEQLVLYHNLSGFTDFLNSMSGLTLTGMNTAHEMLLDALYLSLYNISSNVPYLVSDLQWTTFGIVDSDPPKDSFVVNWRPGADRVIIIFSDEYPQSYFSPKLSVDDLKGTAAGTPQLKLYTFSREGADKQKWEELAGAGNGQWFKLTNSATEMYISLIEILDEICKSGN